ncbi:lipid-binding SYLF domain-containing protein [Lysobacter profundi]|uniref:lipid-binding SYLF domain-containing protein n=1 Tax=Cognatiluteimonas profundi TaxID=2594501 RepID=UPI00131AC6BB
MSTRVPRHRLLPRLGALLFLLVLAGAALAGVAEDERARNAVRVLTDIQAIPESAIPDKLFDEARAIVVVPDAIKAGFIIGGRRGHGLLSVRSPDGSWSNPSFISLTGGSIGLQAGVQSADIVLVFRSDRGLESIVNGKFTLGADAGVAAGPVGRNASAQTDGEMKAEIWSWSRARGLFAGVALDGAVLSIDDAANEAVYGRDTTPRMIFEGRAPQRPSDAVVGFRDRLEETTAAAHAARAPTPAAAATVLPATSHSADPATTGSTVAPVAPAVPGSFEPVQDAPATAQPLPPTPTPTPTP